MAGALSYPKSVRTETDRDAPVRMLFVAVLQARLTSLFDGIGVEVFVAHAATTKLGFLLDGVRQLLSLISHGSSMK